MKINKLILPCLFVGMVIQSCSDQQDITNSNEQGISKSQVLFTIDDFIEDTNTRTNCDPENNYLITWAEGDVIGVFPREGYQEPFEIPAEQVGLESATFDGGYWALKKGKTYNAYYPFSLENFKSAECKTQIPVTYLGQYQNGTDCCVGAYDYTYSDWVTYEDGAAVNFAFHHIGSFLVLSLNIPATTTYTSLTLNAEHEVIPTTGTYDLTAAKPAFVAKTYASSLTMQLNDFEGVAGETSVFYMMIPPMDLSAENMTVTLSTGTASCTYSIESMNIAPRKLVRKTGEPVSSDIPGTINGWCPDNTPYVTFRTIERHEGNFSLHFSGLEYSVDGSEWIKMGNTTDDKAIFGKDYGELRLRGKLKNGTGSTSFFIKNLKYGFFEVSGDIRTLIDYENYETVDTSTATFKNLFKDCKYILYAKDLLLPATDLAEGCYSGMFKGSNVSNSPELPATTLSANCYYEMFSGSFLSTAPELPATTLVQNCYTGMFSGCSNLTTVPELPATTLATACYGNMFKDCTKLTTAPELPATTLAVGCYLGMFSGCTSLITTQQVLPATEIPSNGYRDMFMGCTALETAPELLATTLVGWYNCASMFEGCTSLKTVPDLHATTLSDRCFSHMFMGCTALETAPALPATELASGIDESGFYIGFCYNLMFKDCTKLTTAPDLPALVVPYYSYQGMFQNCVSLIDGPHIAATTLGSCACNDMFNGCKSLTTMPELLFDYKDTYTCRQMFKDCPNLNLP